MMSLCLLTYHKFIEIFLLFLFHNAKCKKTTLVTVLRGEARNLFGVHQSTSSVFAGSYGLVRFSRSSFIFQPCQDQMHYKVQPICMLYILKNTHSCLKTSIILTSVTWFVCTRCCPAADHSCLLRMTLQNQEEIMLLFL